MAVTVLSPGSTAPSSDARDVRWWWVHLVCGCAWLLFAFAVLSGREEITTIWTVAFLAGVLFSMFAVVQFARAVFVEGWRWLHAVLAVASGLAAGTAFLWPGHTFLTLAALIGWFLLVAGVVHIGQAYGEFRGRPGWWAPAVVGGAEILIAFWTIGYPGRSIHVLVLWVAATALTRGMFEVVTAFSLRSSDSTPAGDR